MSFLSDNATKLAGAVTTLQGVILTMIASGTFEGLMDPKDVRWLGIGVTLVGALITGLGFSNTAKVKVAEAMATAIQATPGDPLPPAVTQLTISPEEKP